MTWHKTRKSKSDGILRHIADGSQWKTLDCIEPEFAAEPRNPRLGCSSDGLNPFGNQSSTHSTWPVFVWMYNLPPWLYMKQKYIHMVMLIQGPTQPGNDINTYLELLKEELEILWRPEGVNTWDASTGAYFPMRAALLTTVHDYLGYGYIAGQACHGHCGCVKCMDDTSFLQLSKKGSSKTVFMGHRRWLDKDDEWRTRADLFDNTVETRGPPRKRSGKEIHEMLTNWKDCPKPGKKRKKAEDKMLLKVWKRKSVFWGLKYWELLSTPHSLDMMHITKNVCESLLGTLFDMPERSKDGPRARQDMKDIDIREELQTSSHKTKDTIKGKTKRRQTSQRRAPLCPKPKLIIALQLASLLTRMSFLKFSSASMASKFLPVTQGSYADILTQKSKGLAR